ncbi:MAG: amidohydrolase, partial [Rhodocyclaceae bacterium]|nr:amidohydrolase [Rhodocyclaceae bacterium]
MTPSRRPLLVRSARVLDLDGDLDNPPARDILCEAGAITAVGTGLAAPAGAEVIEASGMLA